MNKVGIKETINLCRRLGWSFIPVKQDKTPLVKWKAYKNRKPTRQEADKWIAMNPFGIAVVTGRISGIVVLDADSNHALKGKQLPITSVSRTQNDGFHYFYQLPSNINMPSSTDVLGKGSKVDIRGEGGYAVLPNAEGYDWCIPLDIKTLSYPPNWLKKCCEKKNKKPAVKETIKDVAPVAGEAYGAFIFKFFKDQRTIEQLMRFFGIEKRIGEPFRCILHADNNPSASIYKADNGYYIFRDWHAQEEILTLPELYASVTTGEVTKLSQKPTHIVWAIRLLIEAKVIKPANVPYRSLNEKASPTIIRTYLGFVRLLECKWIYDYGEPTVFSWRFASDWCQVSECKAGKAIKYLIEFGYIEKVGSTGASSLYKLKWVGYSK